MKRFIEVFSFDSRSISCGRSFLGIALLASVLAKGLLFEVLYTRFGVIPLSVLLPALDTQDWSLFFLNPSIPFAYGLWGLLVGFAVCIIFNINPRLSGFCAYVLHNSLVTRNPWASDAADSLLKTFLLLSLFLPVPNTKESPKKVCSFATVFFILQLLWIYWSVVIFRTGETWRTDLTAMYWILHDQKSSSVHSFQFINNPIVYQSLTWLVLRWEGFAPWIILLPIWNSAWRLFVISGFVALHLGICFIMQLPLFSFIAICGWIFLIPPSAWDYLATVPRAQSFKRRLNFWGDYLRERFEMDLSFTSSSRLVRVLISSLCSGFLFFGAVTSLASAFEDLEYIDEIRSKYVLFFIDAVGFRQGWSMYSPDASKKISWLRVLGEYENGSVTMLWQENEDGTIVDQFQVGLAAQGPWTNVVSFIADYELESVQLGVAKFFCKSAVRRGVPIKAVHIVIRDIPIVSPNGATEQPTIERATLKYPCRQAPSVPIRCGG